VAISLGIGQLLGALWRYPHWSQARRLGCHDEGEFFSSILIENRSDNMQWEVMNVYGPVQHERKADFLLELNQRLAGITHPFILCGDFNMIRYDGKNLQITWIRIGWTLLMSLSQTME
jgi:endonuclease/exonuclease/phosphatase (EEP) superfamily protein YafD